MGNASRYIVGDMHLNSNFQDLNMEYIQNWRVVAHMLLGSRGLNPMELQVPARFMKWHSEIMKVVRLSVDQTQFCKHMHNQEEVRSI